MVGVYEYYYWNWAIGIYLFSLFGRVLISKTYKAPPPQLFPLFPVTFSALTCPSPRTDRKALTGENLGGIFRVKILKGEECNGLGLPVQVLLLPLRY